MITGRRVFLKTFIASALSLPFIHQASASGTRPALAYRRHGRFFVVNGWVLTRADMEGIQRIAATQDGDVS